MRLIWAHGAEENIQAIVDYIAQDSVNAALDMEDRIRACVARLMDMPRSGRIGSEPGTYELVIPRTPYIAIYQVTDLVEVLRVLHGAQQWPPSTQ